MSDYMSRYNFFMKLMIKLFKIPDDDRYGRNSIIKMSKEYLKDKHEVKIVDIAAGRGTDLLNIKTNNDLCKIDMYACEAYDPNLAYLRSEGINTFQVDIERDRLPFEDSSVDIVLANQILEHCKELWWIFAEVHRILKPGGCVLIGVPNLASLHCRLMLLFGKQPPCIETHGPHVRGFVHSDLKYFSECGEFFHEEKMLASGFYFVGKYLASLLVKVFPNLAVCTVLMLRKTDKEGNFIDNLLEFAYETNFYAGDKKTDYIIGKIGI